MRCWRVFDAWAAVDACAWASRSARFAWQNGHSTTSRWNWKYEARSGIEGVEQVAAELLAGGAGQPRPAPDGAQGVKLEVVAVVADVLQPRAKLGRVAEGLLDPRHVFRGKLVGEVVLEQRVVDRGRVAGMRVVVAAHGGSGSSEVFEAQTPPGGPSP